MEELRCVPFVHLQAAGVARIEVLEPEALAFSDAERLDIPLYAVEDFLSRHAAASFCEWCSLRSLGAGSIFLRHLR